MNVKSIITELRSTYPNSMNGIRSQAKDIAKTLEIMFLFGGSFALMFSIVIFFMNNTTLNFYWIMQIGLWSTGLSIPLFVRWYEGLIEGGTIDYFMGGWLVYLLIRLSNDAAVKEIVGKYQHYNPKIRRYGF